MNWIVGFGASGGQQVGIGHAGGHGGGQGGGQHPGVAVVGLGFETGSGPAGGSSSSEFGLTLPSGPAGGSSSSGFGLGLPSSAAGVSSPSGFGMGSTSGLGCTSDAGFGLLSGAGACPSAGPPTLPISASSTTNANFLTLSLLGCGLLVQGREVTRSRRPLSTRAPPRADRGLFYFRARPPKSSLISYFYENIIVISLCAKIACRRGRLYASPVPGALAFFAVTWKGVPGTAATSPQSRSAREKGHFSALHEIFIKWRCRSRRRRGEPNDRIASGPKMTDSRWG